eukprot:gb/GEZN01007375.1/.p1 GENE.gb/GEZN01007375.1/~~gb/GEZN01007375.1/.p1  ORF type:complete len:248 (+),score=38.22 gb/GEZN01007375.1/:243-986(+)
MAQSLVTQVQNPDEVKAQPQPWWRAFCCCGSKPQQQETKQIPIPTQPPQREAGGEDGRQDQQWLLDPMEPEDAKRGLKTLVLDLDETLVHSSFTKINDADFEISIELDGSVYQVFVRKRPGVDEFMKWIADRFEVVIFTASLAKYADPLLDILDKDGIVKKRLFREACVQHFGNYVKDLSLLGRELKNSIIVDNSPFSYMFQPSNAIAITSWFNDKSDNELIELFPKLEQLMKCDDVTTILAPDNQA